MDDVETAGGGAAGSNSDGEHLLAMLSFASDKNDNGDSDDVLIVDVDHANSDKEQEIIFMNTNNNNNQYTGEAEVVQVDDDEPQSQPLAEEGDDDDHNTHPNRPLTKTEIWNLSFALLAWACTVSNVTMVVGTSAVVLLSIGGDDSLTSLPLGTFFIGASLVSLLITPWLFVKCGRKLGFLTGVAIGSVGTGLGCAAVALESTALLTLAMICFGMAMGVGFFLRFAAVEVVPPHWQANAVTLVVSGGIIAAFAGPESAQGMKDALGDKPFMGVFFMTGVFNVCNAIFLSLISFPLPPPVHHHHDHHGVVIHNGHKVVDEEFIRHWEEAERKREEQEEHHALMELLKSRDFIAPMLISSLAWAAMAMPMSIVRVVMGQVGFTSRESLTVIEFHFVGMYIPGFIAGKLISKYGPKWEITVGIVLFFVALVFHFLANEKDDNRNNLSMWVIGLFTIGVAWNFCFTSATIWTTTLYKKMPHLKPKVQAANDFCMFLICGVWIVSASYIFEAGGSGMEGWDVLNWVVFGLVGCKGLILGYDELLEMWDADKANDASSSNSQEEEGSSKQPPTELDDTQDR